MRVTSKLLSLTCVGLLWATSSSCVFAQTAPQEMPAGSYTLDQTHASIVWRVSHLGLSDYTGRFNSFDATLDIDPNKPEKAQLNATINPLSLDTPYPENSETDFDKKLSEGKDWFNAIEFPSITYRSERITLTSPTTAEVQGVLTLLGVSKPLTLNVTFKGAMQSQPFSKKPTIGFSAHGTIKRSEWGFDTYVPNIGDDVHIQIDAELAKAS